MPMSHRLRAIRTSLKVRAQRLFNRFSIEGFLRVAAVKDLELLRSRYHQRIPSYVTATDLAACMELFGLTEHFFSDSCPQDGVYMLQTALAYEVCQVVDGERRDLAQHAHPHAACIDYVERLLLAIDKSPGRDPAAARQPAPEVQFVSVPAPSRPHLVSAQRVNPSLDKRPLVARGSRTHLRLIR